MLQPFYMSVDFKHKKIIAEPIVTQLDDLIFVVTVFDNDIPAVIDGLTYRFVSKRPDGKSFYAEGVKTGDNEITFDLGKPEVTLTGSVQAAIQLFDADMQRISSFTFNYTVIEDISLNDEPTSQDRTLLEIVVEDGPGLVDYFKQMQPLVEQYTKYASSLQQKADIRYVDMKIAGAVNGSPIPVTLASEMTDTTRNYVYLGSEAGYTLGHWYGWNGTSWFDGGLYQSTGLANDGITSDKIAPLTIRKHNLSFNPLEGQEGKNKYNENTVTPGSYVRYADGTLGTNVDFSASDYIRVNPSASYYVNYGNQIAFYDYNKVYISGVDFTTSNPNGGTFDTPSNAAYLRLTVSNTNSPNLQLEKGTVGTTYEPYGNFKLLPNTKVANDNVDNRAISVDKLTERDLIPVLLTGKNLFNKLTVVPNSYAKYADGTLGTNTSYSASDYIPVKPNTDYYINMGDQMPFYDGNKNYVSGINLYSTPSGGTFKTPANAYYLRIAIPNAKVPTLQLELGTAATSYEEYGVKLPPIVKVKNEQVDDYTLNLSKIIESPFIPVMSVGKNLFDKTKVTSGYYVRWADGTFSANASYSASDYMSVKPSTDYTISFFDQVAYYDANKVYVGGTDGYQLGVKTITTPANAAYIRCSVLNTKLSTYQIEEGDASTTYESYGKFINKNNLPSNAVSVKTIQQIISEIVLPSTTKNVKLIGDSITAGVGGTGYVLDGETIYGTYKVNTNGHCWANSLKSYLESKFNCTVKNYGVSGRNSYDLLTNISTIIHPEDDIIICMIGTNDRNNEQRNGVTNSTTTLYNNTKAIVDYVKGLGKEIILMSNIPASIANEADGTKLFHMEDVNNVIMKVAGDSGMKHISVYQLFMDYCDTHNVTIDSLLNDGLHPNDSGYDVMFKLICNALGIATKRPSATW